MSNRLLSKIINQSIIKKNEGELVTSKNKKNTITHETLKIYNDDFSKNYESYISSSISIAKEIPYITTSSFTQVSSSINTEFNEVNNKIQSLFLNLDNLVTSSRSTGSLEREVYRKNLTQSISYNSEIQFTGLSTTGLNIQSSLDIFWGSLLLEPERDYEYGSLANQIKFKIDIPSGDNLFLFVYKQK